MSQDDFDTLWDYQHPGKTEAAFRALLTRPESGVGRSYHLQVLTKIARAQGLQRNFDDAHKTLDGVETQLSDDQLLSRVRYFLEKEDAYSIPRATSDAARPFLQRAWDLSRAEPEAAFFAVDAAHMLAIVAGSFAESVTWNEAALECAKTASDEKAQGWCGSLYNNIGWTYHDLLVSCVVS